MDIKESTPDVVITSPAYFTDTFAQSLREVGLNVLVAKFQSRQQLIDILPSVQILCHRVETRVDAQIIEAAPKLRIVASATAGLDHIDVQLLQEKGITLINDQSKSNTYPTAEFTMALILNMLRNVTSSTRQVIYEANWERESFIGRELKGAVLGLVGCGSIGGTVAHMAHIFGMRVKIYDPFLEEGDIHRLGADTADDLLELFASSDVISLHCPLCDATRGLIGEAELSQLRPGSVLINAARGLVIDQDALIRLIKDQDRCVKVAIDVHDHDPEHDAVSELAREYKNVVLTPHLGASTIEAIQRCCRFLLREILKHIESPQ